MRITQNTRAALAVCAGIFAVSSVAVFFLMRLLLNGLAGSISDSGVAREVISSGALLAISALGGLAFAVVFFSNVKMWIKENGLPGFIPPPDPLDGQVVRVGLSVSAKGGLFQEVYSQWVKAHYISNFLKNGDSNKLTLLKKDGLRLVLVKTTENGGTMLFVKLMNRRRIFYSLELTNGHTGEFQPDEEKKFANCFYQLSFVACTDAHAWLKFGGDYKLLKLLFLN